MQKTNVKCVVKTITLASGLGLGASALAAELPMKIERALRVQVEIPMGTVINEAELLDTVKQQLGEKGIHTNGNITIYPHSEKSSVDLLCFDCVIIDSLEAGLSTPLNLTGSGGGR